MNRRSFIQAFMMAAAAAYTGLPSTEQVSPATLSNVPPTFSGRVWFEDSDGRRLTEAGKLHMRRTGPNQWRTASAFTAIAIETGVAAFMCCDFGAELPFHLYRFEINGEGDGFAMPNRHLSGGSVISITAMEFSANSS